jgi:hypothetical protein
VTGIIELGQGRLCQLLQNEFSTNRAISANRGEAPPEAVSKA